MLLATETEAISLLPPLDVNKTAENVRKFFHHEWPHYVNRAGITPAELKSPSFDAVPKSPSFENSPERKMRVIFEAQTAIACVMETLKSCSEANREVLTYCYIDGLPDWKTAQKMGYSNAQQQRIKSKACCEFAERLDFYQTRFRIDLPELQAFQKGDDDRLMIDS